MTREEAVYHLETYDDPIKVHEAFNMAIKVLKQEPCDDIVSRQAVINLIRSCNSALEEPRIFNCHNAGVKFEQYVTELPSIRPQEPKICEKCLYAEETDGSHCYECVKGESKFEPKERSDKE